MSGSEYSFSDGGIFKCSPRNAPSPARFNQSVLLGVHRGSANDVSRILREMREEFPPGCYDLLSKNCNVFSNSLSLSLIGVEIPRWVNRLAGLGGWAASLGAPAATPLVENERLDDTTEQQSAPPKRKELTAAQKAALAKLKSKTKT